MTIQELYDWALEKGCLNEPIKIWDDVLLKYVNTQVSCVVDSIEIFGLYTKLSPEEVKIRKV